MQASPVRVYAGTLVYGGILDEEFAEHSRTFFDTIAIHSPSEVITYGEEDL